MLFELVFSSRQRYHYFDGNMAGLCLFLYITANNNLIQVLTTGELQQFLVEQQGEHLNEADLDELLERHEPDPSLRAMGIMSFEGFARMLMDEDNYAFADLDKDEDEMSSHPLSHFYIASSHNTYLTGHQLKGESSVELYSQVSVTRL